MTELELTLRRLGGSIDLPATPDLAQGVRRRLEERSRSRWRLRSRRRALAIALATLAVSTAAVMAVPPARTAVLRFLRIGAVTVERVETLPPAQQRPLTAGLGRPLTPEVAARRAGFRMLLPPLDDPPDRVYERGGMQAVLLEGPVLLLEVRGRDQFDLAKKLIGTETRFAETSVNGAFGLWIEGARHVVLFRDRTGRIQEVRSRLAGNVLVWTRGDLTLRLEGNLTKDEALELARSIG